MQNREIGRWCVEDENAEGGLPKYIAILEMFGNADRVISEFDDQELSAATIAEKAEELRRDRAPIEGATVTIHRCEYEDGIYSKRIGRPVRQRLRTAYSQRQPPLFDYGINFGADLQSDAQLVSSALAQLSLLNKQLAEIFEFIEPSQRNMHVYGHRIRNSFLVSCMEFENQCRGIISANGGATDRVNTSHYFKLCSLLKLKYYQVVLTHYPAIPPLSPFSNWEASEPTKSLSWYAAYNEAKHDRDKHFAAADLNSLVHSIAAVAIIVVSQYRVISSWQDRFGDFFEFTKQPDWKQWEHYTAKRDGLIEFWTHRDRPF